MSAPSKKRMALAAALVAALAFGLAGSPVATQATDAVGGTVTDTSRAGNANVAGLPRIQQQGDVFYVSGGVGQDESTALERARSHWPLSMQFIGPGSDSTPASGGNAKRLSLHPEEVNGTCTSSCRASPNLSKTARSRSRFAPAIPSC